MIVRSADGMLHLITQPDHARLAGRIMERWVPLYAAPRRTSILLAIEEHDNGWREPDAEPTLNRDTGRLHDFIDAPAALRQSVWPRGIARLAKQDPWAAALVAEHALTIYGRYHEDDQWTLFFSDIRRRRDALVGECRRTAADLSHDYVFVRVGDLLSLVFCNAWDDEHRHQQWHFRLDGTAIRVTPDAFGGHTIPIAVVAREIADRRYGSDDELQAVVRRAPHVTLRGSVSGAP